MDEKVQNMLANLHLDLMQHKKIGGRESISIDYVLHEIEKIMLVESEDIEDEHN